MNRLNVVDWIAFVLVIIGGLNWGLIGISGYNLVEAIIGVGTIAKVVYVLVGLSAIYVALNSAKMAKK